MNVVLHLQHFELQFWLHSKVNQEAIMSPWKDAKTQRLPRPAHFFCSHILRDEGRHGLHKEDGTMPKGIDDQPGSPEGKFRLLHRYTSFLFSTEKPNKILGAPSILSGFILAMISHLRWTKSV